MPTEPEMNEIDLLIAAKAGDQRAMEGLVMLHQFRLRSYLTRLMANSADADDVAQEVFITALRHLDRIDPAQGLLPWLLTVARNRARDSWRRQGRRREVGGDQAFVALLEAAEECGADDRVQALRRCLKRLPERALAIITGHYRDELACAELAERKGLAVGSVRSLLSRARTMLRRCIEAEGRVEA